MERRYYFTYSLIFSAVFYLGLLACVFCFVAEFRKSKEEDVKLDERLCELPGSEAFEYGIAALICFSTAQIVGNLIMFIGSRPGSSAERRSCCPVKRPTIAYAFLVISWSSFVIGVILISTATSMNRRQPYGKGWLDGECYVVKDGIFIIAAILILISLGCTLASAAIFLRNKFQVPADEKAQKGVFPNGIK